jgi:hypothetical protein
MNIIIGFYKKELRTATFEGDKIYYQQQVTSLEKKLAKMKVGEPVKLYY